MFTFMKKAVEIDQNNRIVNNPMRQETPPFFSTTDSIQ